MKKSRSVETIIFPSRRRFKLYHFLILIAFLYLLFIFIKFPEFLDLKPDDDVIFGSFKDPSNPTVPKTPIPIKPFKYSFEKLKNSRKEPNSNLTELEKMADEAWELGTTAWAEVEADAVLEPFFSKAPNFTALESKVESCPTSLSKKDENFNMMYLPCGLSVGSAITVIGKPKEAHEEYVNSVNSNNVVLVSQFSIELQGLKAVDGEEPPKILHLNPRLRGDWSKMSVIEHNTCYRMQWGKAMRCDGLASKDDEDTVDGFRKCEKWVRSDIVDSKESKTTSWLKRFIGRAKKPAMTWPFPFAEDRLFILTLRAGVEGYHVTMGGRHITSFPYRPGFTLEDATGLAIKGDVKIHSVYATSLPQSHPSFSLQRVLEMSEKWKSPPLPTEPVKLFIGILSATNHFAERMAARKTWMQSSEIRSSNVVARFFVALNQRKEVNAMLKKEAEFFGDLIILPFMDRYELVVLKTIAICEYGVQNVSSPYIMKGDDDTFIRVDAVLREIRSIVKKRSLYLGNLNLLHRPLRNGKWAVTYEEWPEAVYPPYANGPGYIISTDIARFIVSEHANQSLRIFKMEDVSMGMWVEQYNTTKPVQYSHSWKFCQFGCTENYYTAHYQSPRQMICLWDKLAKGHAHCCNFR